jgi:hypothetical protein
VTGKFLGPGTYNDHMVTEKIKKIPCNAVMRPNSIGRESGRACYVMIGDNMMYDPDLENTEIKRKLKLVGVDDSLTNVSALIALGGNKALSKLPQSKNQ